MLGKQCFIFFGALVLTAVVENKRENCYVAWVKIVNARRSSTFASQFNDYASFLLDFSQLLYFLKGS